MMEHDEYPLLIQEYFRDLEQGAKPDQLRASDTYVGLFDHVFGCPECRSAYDRLLDGYALRAEFARMGMDPVRSLERAMSGQPVAQAERAPAETWLVRLARTLLGPGNALQDAVAAKAAELTASVAATAPLNRGLVPATATMTRGVASGTSPSAPSRDLFGPEMDFRCELDVPRLADGGWVSRTSVFASPNALVIELQMPVGQTDPSLLKDPRFALHGADGSPLQVDPSSLLVSSLRRPDVFRVLLFDDTSGSWPLLPAPGERLELVVWFGEAP